MEDFKDCQDYMDFIENEQDGQIQSCEGIGEEACFDCPFYNGDE